MVDIKVEVAKEEPVALGRLMELMVNVEKMEYREKEAISTIKYWGKNMKIMAMTVTPGNLRQL